MGLLIALGALAPRVQRRTWRPLNLVINVASRESVRLTRDG